MRTLQQVLASTHVISCPNLKYTLCLATDASAYGIDGCLYQVIKIMVKHLGFVARTLSPTERNYSASRRELIAFLYCLTKWQKWLSRRKFHYFSDNKGLMYINSQDKITPAIENYYETIFSFEFDVTFCAGVRNVIADHLSRMLYPSKTDQTLEEGMSAAKTEVKVQDTDNSAQKEKEAKVDVNPHSKIATIPAKTDEQIIAASRLDTYQVPQSEEEKQRIIEQCHLAGHYGINSVEKMIKQEHGFNWKHL
ncbi:hypothetical protein A0J61_11590 [Choanephora cucurbitarum]|uniref:Reverse transcriptase/retrotransposon-derived protein RNase H-like domain-containing protein n=1 Tax=Choanephora cucurbitarum TaxID=101091 RepID=A0A1C7MU23_9FUNG|nr:hypothetical protein A0J61_11590 [Choanephora cucurbitarum]